jgi:hypothetical protein
MSSIDATALEKQEKRKQYELAYHREQTRLGAEVGPIPPVQEPERKAACRKDLRLFLACYFDDLEPFSPDHDEIIEVLRRCILEGGRFLNCVYRGFGKTTLGPERTTLWAAVYGLKSYILPIAAESGLANAILDSIKLQLLENDKLAEDFPEVILPIRHAEGIAQRCHSQMQGGRKTNLIWTADRIVLPRIAGSPASGCVIKARGLTSSLRGMRESTAAGVIRPDLVLLDDPQTDESAASPAQCWKRLGVIRKTILLLGGHGKRLSCVMNATPIEPDDLVDQLLDHKRNPDWRTVRKKMVLSWSKAHETLWLESYAGIRQGYNPDDPNDQIRAERDATRFYEERRAEMDLGARVSWEYCKGPGEISAIQHAYNLLIDEGEDVFAAEYQLEPRRPGADLELLTAAEIREKISGYPRGVVPPEASRLTAYIDVQGRCLYWLVAAWTDRFSGYVLDYGVFPDQGRSYFTLRDVRRTLRRKYRGTDEDGAIFAGLGELTKAIFGRDWVDADGTPRRCDIGIVDAQWGQTSKLIYSFVRQSPFSALLLPGHGRGVRATHKPISQWGVSGGRRRPGIEWVITKAGEGRGRSLTYDTNYWKKRTHDALAMALGSARSLVLFKARPDVHRMIADHLLAETPKKTESEGKTVFEWLPLARDNHLFDCLVGSMVAASVVGIAREEDVRGVKRARKRRRVQYL